jgi:hypothetical protein
MASTYNPSLAADLDRVRFTIGDTAVPNTVLSDEEINALITAVGVNEAAALCAESIAARYAKQPDQKTGDIDTKYSQLFDHFMKLADSIRENGVFGGAQGAKNAFAGGISIAANDAAEQNSDRPETAFSKGMHDNPLAGVQDGSEFDSGSVPD